MSSPIQAREAVIVVHGLWVNSMMMRLLGYRIQRCGFDVAYFSYDSVRAALEQNAARLSRFAAALSANTVHWVGHSLGGIVILKMLEQCPEPRTGRIVLMGSPSAGSYAARALAKTDAGRWLLGRSTPLVDNKAALHGKYELGVIAGCRGLGLGRLMLHALPRPNDGVVTVAETHVSGMHDHIVLRLSHSGMLFSSRAAKQVCAFLKAGRFIHR
ncbi:MAG: esterase/lipase family protein [Burkholderiales bacterium]